MENNIIIYFVVAAVTIYLIRVLPMTLIRKDINSRFLRSFLYYVPYVTLAVMTFPAILQATETPVAGALALLAGIVLAWRGANLFYVSLACCTVVLMVELLLCH